MVQSPPPFSLPSNIIYFHDWRYIQHGGYRWLDEAGVRQPLWAHDAPDTGLRYEAPELPAGVRLQAMPAQKSEPVIEAAAEDVILFPGSLIHEGGRYRLWYEVWPAEMYGRPMMGHDNYLYYAESDDGGHWRHPSLGLVERHGSTAHAAVIGPALTAPVGFHGSCVFRDDSAPADRRYRTFYLATPTPGQVERYRRERPEDPVHFHGNRTWALCGGYSPDGLHWTMLPDPLVMQISDTLNCCEYDPVLNRYVAYCRMWCYHRRTIGRIESERFERMPPPVPLFWPGAGMRPSDLWYAQSKSCIPGSPDHHVMFPMRWAMTEDRFDFFLATSPDNRTWTIMDGGPVCRTGDPGAWDGGVVVPGIGLVDLPGDRTGLLIQGSPVPHKYPRRAPLGRLGWAWWRRGRLAALVCDEAGSFTLQPLLARGRSVVLNFKTGPTGYIQVEALGPDHTVLPGRCFADCDMLTGDHLDRPVTWRGQSDLAHPDRGPVTLRFRLRQARMYSASFA